MLKEYSISDIISSEPQGKFYYAGTFEGTKGQKIEFPHRHSFYSFVWFTSGKGINVIDFNEYKIKPNRLFLMHPKQVHNWSYSKGTKGYILVLDKYFTKNFPIELSHISYFDFTENNTELLKPLFDNLIKETILDDKLSEKSITSGVNYLTSYLVRLSTKIENDQKLKSQEIIEFSKLISDSISENVSIKEYAKKLNITTEKLNELCKKNYGENPKSIILNSKITEAKRLLYFTELSIKEITYKIGFKDSSYFSRIFKQKTNLSPSDFKTKVP